MNSFSNFYHFFHVYTTFGMFKNLFMIHVMILKILFAGLTKAAASAVFDSCYVYNSLFYTTEIRTTAVLFSANVGVVGSFLSPQVRYLGVLVWQPLTYIFYAFNAFASIGVLFLLDDPSKKEFK